MFKSTQLKAHFTSPIKCKYWSNNGLTLWLRRANYMGILLKPAILYEFGLFFRLAKMGAALVHATVPVSNVLSERGVEEWLTRFYAILHRFAPRSTGVSIGGV